MLVYEISGVGHHALCIFALHSVSSCSLHMQDTVLGTVSQLKMSELKGKYSPYFELIVDNIKNKRYLKCKVCGDGTTLAYNGNTSSMKAHLEAKHKTEYKTVFGGMCQLVNIVL